MIPEIDLHGMDQNKAINHLSKQFILYRVKGIREVRVITGRGNHTKGGIGKLFKKVPQWLKGVKFKSIVKSVRTIPNNPGALVVILKG